MVSGYVGAGKVMKDLILGEDFQSGESFPAKQWLDLDRHLWNVIFDSCLAMCIQAVIALTNGMNMTHYFHHRIFINLTG